MEKSKIFTVDQIDLIKGLVVAVLTTTLTLIVGYLNKGSLPTAIELQAVGVASLTAGSGYILKNFLTTSKDKFMSKESA